MKMYRTQNFIIIKSIYIMGPFLQNLITSNNIILLFSHTRFLNLMYNNMIFRLKQNI